MYIGGLYVYTVWPCHSLHTFGEQPVSLLMISKDLPSNTQILPKSLFWLPFPKIYWILSNAINLVKLVVIGVMYWKCTCIKYCAYFPVKEFENVPGNIIDNPLIYSICYLILSVCVIKNVNNTHTRNTNTSKFVTLCFIVFFRAGRRTKHNSGQCI